MHHFVDELFVLDQSLRVRTLAHQGCKHRDDGLLYFGYTADQAVEHRAQARIIDHVLEERNGMSRETAEGGDSGQFLRIARAMREEIPQHLEDTTHK